MRDADMDKMVWCMFYAGLCSFVAHPGRKPLDTVVLEEKKVLDFYALMADHMFERYYDRFIKE